MHGMTTGSKYRAAIVLGLAAALLLIVPAVPAQAGVQISLDIRPSVEEPSSGSSMGSSGSGGQLPFTGVNLAEWLALGALMISSGLSILKTHPVSSTRKVGQDVLY